MTTALSGGQRTALERLVQGARRWIEEDLEKTLEGKFGINGDGRIEPSDRLTLSNAEDAVRLDLVEIVEYLRSEGEGEAESVDRLVREAAFTHTNRLIAVRVAEAVGLLPETMARGAESTGFRDFSELAPTIAATEWGRFAEFVALCADELAADVPALFDPRNPLLELAMSETVLARVVDAMAALDVEVWAAPDTLGWAYQFFNTGEERREMRESSAPRNSRELAVRNQFFTPSYVVEFLVHNGLGAHLAAGFPGLADELPLLVEVPTEQIEVDLEAVSVLDPACGSGHFLLGAYDVLELAWQHAGLDAATAAPAIVGSLWGIDIDPRATQIAQAAVMFRARRHCRDEKLPKANVICARALPAGPEVDDLIAGLPEHVGRAVRGIAADLVDAPILGPLLKIEERLSREVRDVFGTGVVEGTLAEAGGDDDDNIEAAVLAALTEVADSTTSSAAQRLFAAEAHDAVRFVEAMARRYTAVLMNPPFGEPVPSVRTYLKGTYPANSTRTADLFAAFVDRGRQLVDGGGSLGAITTRAGMFLQSYERWRKEVFLPNGRIVVADLGFGVMEQAMVEAAAYVLALPTTASGTMTVLSVLDHTDRPQALKSMAAAARGNEVVAGVHRIQSDRLLAIPGMRVAYWCGDAIGAIFERLPPLESGEVKVRRGIQTGDDFRFLRLDWEIGTPGERWRPIAKGGPYCPFMPLTHLLVDWGNGGADLIGYAGSIVPSVDLYFKPGVTWSRRTMSSFGPRLLEEGVAFSDKGPAIIGGDPLWQAIYLNSRLARTLVETMVAAGETTTSGSASRSYDTGLVGLVPFLAKSKALDDSVEQLWDTLLVARNLSSWKNEPLSSYHLPPSLMAEWAVDDPRATVRRLERDELRAAAAVIEANGAVERAIITSAADECGIPPEELEAAVTAISGPDLSSVRQVSLAESAATMWELEIDSLIDSLTETFGGSRNIVSLSHVVHRRLEVICHATGRHPESVMDGIVQSNSVSPEFERAFGSAVVSWLVGQAFGSAVSNDLPSDVNELVHCGIRREAAVEHELLLDQSGHDLDMVTRLSRKVNEGNSEALFSYAAASLGWKGDLPNAVRRKFFGLHLSMYSMSRRKAPIYWQLQVPSKSWGVWLYAPRLSREMLFAVVRETEQRQRLAEQQIAHLQREAESGSGGRKASEVAKELEAEQRLAVELETFRAEAERIAHLGWEPDLDDGMVLNAAPLADLFPAWKDAASYRKELRAGKYEWATVAQYADQL